jgi:glycosyltransferase involved in cell wall biosynthesis
MAPTLTLIIPTIGRPLLERLLDQASVQIGAADEILVIGDGFQPAGAAMVEKRKDPRIHYHEFGPSKCWGHPQRNYAMLLASGSHIMFLDDDDETIPGAFDIIRKAVQECPEKLLIFRIHHREFIIWTEPEIRLMNVSTQCFVVPNAPERFGTWGARYAGDLDFITTSVEKHPDRENGIAWREEIIAIHGEADYVSEEKK